MVTRKLGELAGAIRSKNAGVNQITFDIIFDDEETYRKVIKSGALNVDAVARIYGIGPERISSFVEFHPANAIKFSIYRLFPSGSPGDWDILGCQQYGPLLDVEIPWD